MSSHDLNYSTMIDKDKLPGCDGDCANCPDSECPYRDGPGTGVDDDDDLGTSDREGGSLQ